MCREQSSHSACHVHGRRMLGNIRSAHRDCYFTCLDLPLFPNLPKDQSDSTCCIHLKHEIHKYNLSDFLTLGFCDTNVLIMIIFIIYLFHGCFCILLFFWSFTGDDTRQISDLKFKLEVTVQNLQNLNEICH